MQLFETVHFILANLPFQMLEGSSSVMLLLVRHTKSVWIIKQILGKFFTDQEFLLNSSEAAAVDIIVFILVSLRRIGTTEMQACP